MASPAPAAAPTPAVAPPKAAVEQKSLTEKFSEFLNLLVPMETILLRAAPELGHLSQMYVVLGTFFFALVTWNGSFAILGLTTLEATFIKNMLKGLGSYIATPFVTPTTTDKACSSFYQTITPSRFKMFMESGIQKIWPNGPLYYLSFFAAYCIQSMVFYKEETSARGPAYSNRPYIASIAAALLLSLYLVYLLSYGCESFLSLIFAIIAGLVIGILLCIQNNAVFGKEYINLLFIPPMVRNKNQDYVCVTPSSS